MKEVTMANDYDLTTGEKQKRTKFWKRKCWKAVVWYLEQIGLELTYSPPSSMQMKLFTISL
jgi:hypothetical protein